VPVICQTPPEREARVRTAACEVTTGPGYVGSLLSPTVPTRMTWEHDCAQLILLVERRLVEQRAPRIRRLADELLDASPLALEASRFVQEKNLVTVPPLAADVWLMRMMSAEAQKTNPFFLGGDDIIVSYPTDTMSEDEKVQALRANNRHFSRATVFHELIPGHHLQYYWRQRSNRHRILFETPFWIEGWSLWWEFHLWDLKFTSTPEDRMGALFWRAHRCARIIFSLKFHLGEWTPQQCIDFLVERVGHERASATGEVRRSFNGAYSPLYQAGYMLGALQIRALYTQLVVTGKMPEKDFHDNILKGGTMPIEMVRVHLTQEKLPRDFKPTWRFADP